MKRPFFKTIRGSLFLVILTLVLILGIGISSVSYLLFYRDLQKTVIQSTETSLELLAENINNHLDDFSDLLRWCGTNDQISQFFLTSRESERYNRVTSTATDMLNTTFSSNPSREYIHWLVICPFDRQDYLQIINADYSVDKNIPELIQNLPYYEEYMETANLDSYRFQIVVEDFAHYPALVIPIIRPIQHPYSSRIAGFVYLSVSQELFVHEMSNYTLDDANRLFLKIGDAYYRLDGSDLTSLEAAPEFEAFSENYHIQWDTKVSYLKNADGKQLAVSRPLSFGSCAVIQTVSPGNLRQQLSRYLLLGLLIFGVVLLIGLIITGMLSRLFTQPVTRLRNRIGLIAGGDFSRDDTILWDNELGDMGRDINQLSQDIQTLIDNRLTAENEKRDYEYQLLQSQINPHFLYNTLNSIKWMATVQKADGIAEMTLALSRLFKNISKSASLFVTIRQEFDLLGDYFTIQKYRYGGMISLEYDVANEALLCNEIPRFSLQPIVENSIFHGIEPTGHPGAIKIKLYQAQADTVCIDVTDNGVGISADKIGHLLTEDVPDRGSFFRNVGVSNVHRYLQYTYGERYGLHIESEPGQYTTVTIQIPFKVLKEEEQPS